MVKKGRGGGTSWGGNWLSTLPRRGSKADKISINSITKGQGYYMLFLEDSQKKLIQTPIKFSET